MRPAPDSSRSPPGPAPWRCVTWSRSRGWRPRRPGHPEGGASAAAPPGGVAIGRRRRPPFLSGSARSHEVVASARRAAVIWSARPRKWSWISTSRRAKLAGSLASRSSHCCFTASTCWPNLAVMSAREGARGPVLDRVRISMVASTVPGDKRVGGYAIETHERSPLFGNRPCGDRTAEGGLGVGQEPGCGRGAHGVPGETAWVHPRLPATATGGVMDREHAGGEVQRLGGVRTLQTPGDELVAAKGCWPWPCWKPRDATANSTIGDGIACCRNGRCQNAATRPLDRLIGAPTHSTSKKVGSWPRIGVC